LNDAILVNYTILKIIAALVVEAELGALFLNVQETKVIHLILHELGHPQPPTPIHIDYTTAVRIFKKHHQEKQIMFHGNAVLLTS